MSPLRVCIETDGAPKSLAQRLGHETGRFLDPREAQILVLALYPASLRAVHIIHVWLEARALFRGGCGAMYCGGQTD